MEYPFFMQFRVTIPPESVLISERGMMLSSVLMVKSYIKSWHSSPLVAEKII